MQQRIHLEASDLLLRILYLYLELHLYFNLYFKLYLYVYSKLYLYFELYRSFIPLQQRIHLAASDLLLRVPKLEFELHFCICILIFILESYLYFNEYFNCICIWNCICIHILDCFSICICILNCCSIFNCI